jgi:hypothetical protein
MQRMAIYTDIQTLNKNKKVIKRNIDVIKAMFQAGLRA